MIVGYNKFFGYREKADTSIETTNETFRLFQGMLLLSERHKFPDRIMYWKTTADTFVQAMSYSMYRYTFERILWNLHLCGNKQFDK